MRRLRGQHPDRALRATVPTGRRLGARGDQLLEPLAACDRSETHRSARHDPRCRDRRHSRRRPAPPPGPSLTFRSRRDPRGRGRKGKPASPGDLSEQQTQSRLVSPMRELERDFPTTADRAPSAERPAGARDRRRGPRGLLDRRGRRPRRARGHAQRARRRPRGHPGGRDRAALRPRRGDRHRRERARARAAPRFAGHTSGATGLDALAPLAAAGASTFSLHPLQTVPDAATEFTGSPCAISASDPEAMRIARALAEALGMRPFEIAEVDRAAYHAAACMASNFLVALEEAAADLLAAHRRRRRPRAARADRPAHRGELVRARRGRAHRPDRPRRRGDGRAAPEALRRTRSRAPRPLLGARRARPGDRLAARGSGG